MDQELKAKMIERIQKLLNLGANNPNGPESELANKKAAELMAQFAIEISEIREFGKSGVGRMAFERMNIEIISQEHWEGSLANVIAMTFDAKVILVRGFGSDNTLAFCGTKNDLEIIIYFHKYLRRTIGKMADKYGRKDDRNSFGFGCVRTIKERLQDLYEKRNVILNSTCKDLVVVKASGLEKFVADEFGALKHTKARTTNYELFKKGVEAGHKINLFKGIKENGTTANPMLQ